MVERVSAICKDLTLSAGWVVTMYSAKTEASAYGVEDIERYPGGNNEHLRLNMRNTCFPENQVIACL
jgi:hypothetical protein